MTRKNFRINSIALRALFILFIFCCIVAKSQTDKKGAAVLNPQQSLFTGTKAIIVGISEYMNIQSLNYAHTDAQNFYNFLISDAGGNVSPDNVVLLLNNEATSANIYAALDWLVDEAKECERIIIYFSGHGDLENKTIRQNGFLLGHDSPKNCYMAGGTVGVGYLQDYLETIALQNKSEIVLITDACRSGKLAGGQEGASNTTAALAQNWNNITKVLSSQAGEFSFEGDKWGDGAGVFTHYLINGLTGLADKNNNKEVNTQELYMYLLENIGRETEWAQNPTLVGNMTSTLVRVDSLSLAMLEHKMQVGANEMLALKGIEDMYEKQLDEITLAKYKSFRYCLENDLLIPEYSEGENSWDIYQNLINSENANVIHKHIKRSLLAALQNKSQIVINYYLGSQKFKNTWEDERSKKELEYACNLVDPNYILFNDIKGRFMYYQSFESNSIENQIALLKKGIGYNPDAAYLYERLGEKYYKIKQYDSAIIIFKKAIKLAPTWKLPYYCMAWIYRDLGEIAFKRKDYDGFITASLKSIEFYRKKIEVESEERSISHDIICDIYYDIGDYFYEQKQYDQSAFHYQKGIEFLKVDEDDWNDPYIRILSNSYYKLGRKLYKENQYEEALDELKKAIELVPDDAYMYYDLGVTYKNLTNYIDALNCFGQAILLKQDYSDAYYNHGICHMKLSQYTDAIVSFEMAIELEPDDIYAFANLGICYRNLQLYDKSNQQYQNALELNPDYVFAISNIANNYRKIEQFEDAVTWYHHALVKDSTHIESLTGLGYCYIRMEEFQLALNAFKKTIELAPKNPGNDYNIVCLYALQNKDDSALIWLEKSLEKGYENWDHLEKDTDLDNIRDTEKYKDLINKYKKQN